MWEIDICRKGSRRLTFRLLFVSLISTNTKNDLLLKSNQEHYVKAPF